MVTIKGHELWRGGQKIGWIEENHVFDHEGKKLGYFADNAVFDVDGKKLAHLEGNKIHVAGGGEIRLDDNAKAIVGGVFPDECKAAIRLLLGE